MADVVVIGAGFGGLSAAVALAAAGRGVDVLEAGPRPGGKADVVVVDGVEADTGPSLLTLPELVDAAFRRAGTTLAEQVELVEPEPAFRYLWPDGARFDVHPRLERTLESAREAFGAPAAAELERYLAATRRIWEVAAPNFVLGPAPTPSRLLRMGPRLLAGARHIDGLRSLQAAIDEAVREPHLRDVLLRYATYVGSDPRRLPATLGCIAHVELALGGYGVRGGMGALVRALVRVAEGLGVHLHLERPVRGLLLRGGRVVGVRTDEGELSAAEVVCNADVAHLVRHLLPGGTRGVPAPTADPSTSGWTGILRARRAEDRVAHTVLFPSDYRQEFRDLFDHRRPPREPTVYLCAQERAHGREGWPLHEPVFVMANAPAEPVDRPTHPSLVLALRETSLRRLREAKLVDGDDALLWERGPAELAERFPGTRGALYGAASHGATAAFRRPPNRLLPGLVLASGSAHPGGGVPLCVRSGLLAADAVLEVR